MALIRLDVKTYSDVEFVTGVSEKKEKVIRALHVHCKEYFDRNYRGVFYVEDEYKDEIFHESFTTFWENIFNRKIYVEDGVLKGKGGELFSGTLTTYFMSIARLKFLGWTRERRKNILKEENKLPIREEDIRQFDSISYPNGDEIMIEIIADSLSRMAKRCREIITMFYGQEKTLDSIMAEIPGFESKNALKTRKYKCMEELRKTANARYRKYLNT